MNYIGLSSLKKKLKNVDKDIIVAMLHESVKYKSELEIEDIIIHIKKSENLRKQREILDKITAHGQCDNKDLIKWLAHHKEWERLNNILNKLNLEYDDLTKQQEKIGG